jgi:hypothetical protein
VNFDKLSREILPSHFNISSKIVGELGVVAAQHKKFRISYLSSYFVFDCRCSFHIPPMFRKFLHILTIILNF